MWMLPSPFAAKQRMNRSPSRGFRPRLEALEDRWCPTGGVMEWADPSGNGAADVAVQPDGKIVSVGHLHTNQIFSAIQVMRLNTDGSMDTTFNGSGVVTLNFGSW